MDAMRTFASIVVLFLLILPISVRAESADLIVVKKAARRIILMRGEKPIEQFNISLGGSPVGPKHCEGDQKTPEGDYKIVARNAQSKYYKSLQISYPNSADRKYAATKRCNPGGDIMIHGLPNGYRLVDTSQKLPDWTIGCIAVKDSEMDKIWELVPVGTAVRIEP